MPPEHRKFIVALLTLAATLTAELAFWPHGADGSRLAARFGAEYCARAAAYSSEYYPWIVAAVSAQFWLLLTMSSSSVSRALVRTAQGFARGPVAVATGVALIWCAATRSLSVAIAFGSRYLLEKKYGLTDQSVSGWFSEQACAQAISVAIVLAATAVTFWLAGRLGRRWWVAGTAALWLGILVFVTLEPLVIDPIFDRYTPLSDRKDAKPLLALAERVGFDPARLSVADASHRTSRTNAFINGLGPTERIALWDTLLVQTPPAEVELVLAHELGHWEHRDVLYGTLAALAGVAVGAAMLAFLFPLPGPRDVPAMLFAVYLMNLSTLPAQNALSRHIEARADHAALELTHHADLYVRCEERLAKQNLSDLDPPPFVVWLLYTHPPTADRIAMGENFRP